MLKTSSYPTAFHHDAIIIYTPNNIFYYAVQDSPTSNTGAAIAVGIIVPIIVCSSILAAVLIVLFILRRKKKGEKMSSGQEINRKNRGDSDTGLSPLSDAQPAADYEVVNNGSNSDTNESGTNQEEQEGINPKTPSQSNPDVYENLPSIDTDKPKEGYSQPEPVAASEAEDDRKGSSVDPPNNPSTSTSIMDNSTHGDGDGNGGTIQNGDDKSSLNASINHAKI